MDHQLDRKKFLAQSGGAVLGMSALGGLAGRAAARAATGRTAATTFDLWYTTQSNAQDVWLKKNDFALFNRTHPNVQINAVKRPLDSIDRVIATALKAGQGPDVVQTPGASYAATYATAGYLAPLDDYVKQYRWNSKLLTWALQSGKLNGHIYSVPFSYETIVIYYNKTLFAQKGYKVPQNRADLEALCTELSGQGITPFMAGSAEWKPATEWFVTVFLNHGAGPEAVYEALSGKRKWTDPVFVDAITLLADWFKKGWFGGGVSRYFTNRFAPQYASLGSGKSAMDMEGSWALGGMSDNFGKKAGNRNDWDWFPIPPLSSHAPKNLYCLATGGTYSINAKSKVADAAATYLDWEFSTPKRSGQAVADIGNEPYPLHLKPADFPKSTDKRILRMYAEIAKSTAGGKFGYTTWTYWGPKSDVWSYQGMDRVLTGSMSAKDYLAQMQRFMDVERAKKQLPPLIAQG